MLGEEQKLLANFLEKLMTSLSDERWEETDKAFHVACSLSVFLPHSFTRPPENSA